MRLNVEDTLTVHQQYHFRESANGLLAWDVLKLIELTKGFDVIDVPLTDIQELNEDYWFSLGSPPLTKNIALHAKQIYEADLTYPVILCPQGRIMDGMHRVCKAFLASHESIQAVKLKTLHDPDYIGKEPHELPY